MDTQLRIHMKPLITVHLIYQQILVELSYKM